MFKGPVPNLNKTPAVQTTVPDNANERPPVEAEVIEERDVEPMGEGHRSADPVPHPEFPPPSYEANQGQRGRDINPGGSTDPNNIRTHADSGDQTGRD